ncbi:hypothetical protein G5V58_23370 [Nocardioides anomalus]|uniref:PH domain-containing protein n=1 Tax=Nocardioides anomalus TaxID=2712223 RepID=A0A6G6WIZ2_9ACTN|nr:hypothetical protein [Nocardioides anomalus]QIG45298.1 hypothetical protein G5V58_23370 [Nocardioides anomalus]
MVELPPRRILVVASALVALLFSPVLVWTVRHAAAGAPAREVVAGALGSVLLCGVPLWGAVLFARQHVYVGPDAVQVRYGERVVRELRFADLTEVRTTRSGAVESVLLVGSGADGRPRGIKVTRSQVQSLEPLLDALRPELGRRPQLRTTRGG